MTGSAPPLDLSIITPCHNEEFDLPELTQRVLAMFDTGGLSGELLLVDDGSNDGTPDVIRKLRETHGERVVGLFHRANRGMVAAWRTGANVARGSTVCIFDADLQYQPEDILRLYRRLMESSVDVVQGARSSIGRLRNGRYVLSRGLNHVLNTTFGMDLTDNKSGFLCCAKEILLDLLTYKAKYAHWQSLIMVAAHAKGYSYMEIPTLFEERRHGTSSLDGRAYRVAAENFIDVGKAFIEYRLKTKPRDDATRLLAEEKVEAGEPPSRRADPLRWRSYMASFQSSHWFITKNVERHCETLNATQWLSPEAIGELQDAKLRLLIRHAYRCVPYYRARMRELKLHPEDIRTRHDLAKLPFLERSDVRKNLHFEITSESASHANMLRISTSGSTDEPFVCYADRSQVEFRWAATLRGREWTGYRFGDPCARLWPRTFGLTGSQVRKERLDAWFARRSLIPVFEMTETNLREIVQTLSDTRPVLIEGYAEALDFLARFLEAFGGLSAPPRALISSAQSLPASSRELIERAFGCKVFDKYGSREFSGIAYESDAHDGHLVVAESYIVEVLVDGRPAEPGEIGEIVVTDLNNYCMPFIRYRIGDLAQAVEARPSRCGRGLPRLGEIQGRVQSIIQGTDGHFVPGTFFPHLLRDYEHVIQRFQVVQDEPGAIRLVIVKARRYSDDTLEEIKATIRRYLGDGLRIDVVFQDRIETTQSGRPLASVSRLPIDFQRQALRSALRLA